MWLLTYLIGTPSKTKNKICISASICLTCPTQIQRRPPTRLVKRCPALYLFKQRNRDNHPRQRGPNSVEENICEQKLQDLKPGPHWEFHTVVKEGPARGIWEDLCTRTSWRLPLQTFIQAPSRSSRKYLLEDSSRMCARSPHKHLYNKGFH